MNSYAFFEALIPYIKPTEFLSIVSLSLAHRDFSDFPEQYIEYCSNIPRKITIEKTTDSLCSHNNFIERILITGCMVSLRKQCESEKLLTFTISYNGVNYDINNIEVENFRELQSWKCLVNEESADLFYLINKMIRNGSLDCDKAVKIAKVLSF